MAKERWEKPELIALLRNHPEDTLVRCGDSCKNPSAQGSCTCNDSCVIWSMSCSNITKS